VKAIFKTLALASLLLALGFRILLFVPSATANNSGWSIDLFCQRGGVGKNVACSSLFVVGDRITLFAYLTYNQVPVQSVLVAFQVDNPQGSPIIITTAQTNASGYATTDFTITENTYPVFPSLWNSIATASPTQQTVNDTMPFTMVGRLTVAISPTFTIIFIGSSVIFTSTVTGGIPPYSYQWYLNGTAVHGANGPIWVFTPTFPGTYYVYLNVTDSRGARAESNIAKVIVLTIPLLVGGRSTSTNAANFLAPWLSIVSLLVAGTMLKGIILRKRRN
jgi:hypothetical protein